MEANCHGERRWSDAIEQVSVLAGNDGSGCGLRDSSRIGDWRLPNVKEIQSLMDYGNTFPDLLLPAGHPFIGVQVGGITSSPSSYWTSTSTGSDNDGVYSVSLSVGWVERLSLSSSFFELFVWPVRDGT